MPDYTPYQKGIIKRYYEHSETLALQKLSEIVSDLYLAESEARTARLWKRAAAALAKLPAAGSRADRIVGERDLRGLAVLLTDMDRAG